MRCQCFASVVSAVACLISSRGLNQPPHIPNAALSSEGGGIAKRIKTARLRRKTKLQKSKFALDKIKKHQRAHHNVGTCLWHVSMQTYNVSAHWKHAKGMSLRYGVLIRQHCVIYPQKFSTEPALRIIWAIVLTSLTP